MAGRRTPQVEEIARHVYGTASPTPGQVAYVRRTCRQTQGVTTMTGGSLGRQRLGGGRGSP